MALRYAALIAAVGFLFCLLTAGFAYADNGVPRPDHIVVVMEENHSYNEIIGSSAAPYINSLASQGALFTQSFAVEHPSEPNYLDIFSGSNQGVTDDSCPHDFSTANLGAEALQAGDSFTGYAEDLPSVGATDCTSGEYARKHCPWVDFDTGSNAIPAGDSVPFQSYFPTDYSALPAISFVTPNLLDDMHDGTIQEADTWLQSNIDGYAQWAKTHNSLLIVTWDEDDSTENNQIPTIFVGQMVKPGAYSETINHYNILRTIEDAFGLPYAGNSASVSPITDAWNSASGAAVLQINSAGPAVGAWAADEDFNGGSLDIYNTDTINTSAPNAAPEQVYQTERYGPSFSYSIPNLTPNAAYTVRLHFNEDYWGISGRGGGTGIGDRLQNVFINGAQVLSGFDVCATAGGPDIAVVEQFATTADSSGMITISFSTTPSSTDQNAAICGIEIYPNQQPFVQINSAGPAVGAWAADEDYSGGSLDNYFADTIDTSAPNAAPEAVYQDQRYGSSFSYTIPGLTPNAAYTVRLHFSEDHWGIAGRGGGTGIGDRLQNVFINGVQVLSGFDVCATAGGPDIAVVEPFTTTADSGGNITIAFSTTPSSLDQNAAICGIEVLQ